MKTVTHRLVSRFLSSFAGTLLVATSVWQARAQVGVTAQPPNGATEVPLSAAVVFTFSEPMETGFEFVTGDAPFVIKGNIHFAGVAGSLLTATWDESATTLTVECSGNLPAGQLISWTINPDGMITPPLISEDADIVPTTSGSFTTAGQSCDPDGFPDEWGSVTLFKSVTYLQTSTATPVLKPDEKPALFVGVSSPDNNAVSGATFTKPGAGASTPLTLLPISPPTFFYSEEFNTENDLNSAYPSGSYGFNLTRVGPPSPTVFSMVQNAGATYPPVPQVSNYTAAQTIDPAQNFTLSFNALTGASGSDAISLDISDSQGNPVLSAPNLCIPLPLPNTATSFVIPANTLVAGQTYTVRLTFSRTFYASTTAPPEFASFGALQRQTVLTISTGGGGGAQPQLAVAGFQSGFFGFNVTGLQPATNYRIQYSSTLLPGSWQLLQTVNTTTPLPIFDLTSNPNIGWRYYRVITP